MSKRDWGTIKSILHFDFPYFNEPGDGLYDEAAGQYWTIVNTVKLAGMKIPYAIEFEPKFGYRCAYFASGNSYVKSPDKTLNIDLSGSYEREAFINWKSSSGVIFKYTGSSSISGLYLDSGKLRFYYSVDEEGNELYKQTSSAVLTSGTWHHILQRFVKGVCTVWLDGIQLEELTATITADIPINYLRVGGFIGYIDEFVFRTSAGSGTPTVPTQPYNATLDVSKIGGFGTGADDDVTISANAQINSYGMINSITDAKTFSVSSWNNGTYTPAVGSELMLHITAPKSPDVADYPNAGLYAFGKIASIDGVNVELEDDITTENGYDFTFSSDILTDCYVQVITVPNFKTLTVNSGVTITPLTWGTSTGGGIVAFRVKGDCTINGSILTHGRGAVRYDLHQMENSKLIDRFLCAQGGGIFATCGGTFSTSENARLGASWSGLGEGGDGASGYGGTERNHGLSFLGVGGGTGGCGLSSTSSVGGVNNTRYTPTGQKGANTSTVTVNYINLNTRADAAGANGGGGCGGDGGDCAASGSKAFYKVSGSGGGGQGGSGGTAGSASFDYNTSGNNYNGVNGGASKLDYSGTGNGTIEGGAGGGAPGGNGGNSYSREGGIAGACTMLIAQKISITQSSISTGGEGGLNNVGAGGTGFCYIAAKELINNE